MPPSPSPCKWNNYQIETGGALGARPAPRCLCKAVPLITQSLDPQSLGSEWWPDGLGGSCRPLGSRGLFSGTLMDLPGAPSQAWNGIKKRLPMIPCPHHKSQSQEEHLRSSLWTHSIWV